MMQKLLFSITAFLLVFSTQAQTVIIGAGAQTGTSSNSATGDCGPMYRSSATSNFVYSMHHYLYTQAELSTAGIPVGAVITNLAWNKDNNAASNANFLFQIWMKNSALTTVQTAPQTLTALTTGSTSVYNSSATAVSATVGYVDFLLTTPFVYTGGALEITVNFNMSSGSSPWTTAGVSWKRDAITNRTLSYCNSVAGTSLNNLRTVRPQLRITYSASSCASPTALTATSITQTGANISWTAAAGSIGYEYIVDQNPGNPAGAGTALAGTGTSVSGLVSSTTYYLHVRNKCSASGFSPWVTISFVTAACPAAGGLSATAVTQTTATLSWTGVSGSVGYEYVLDQNAGNPAGAGTATMATSFGATSLTSASTYYLHVRNRCNSTNYSAWATISFITQACPTPTALVAANVGQTTADLSWTGVPGNGYEYVIDQLPGNPAGAGAPLAGTSFTATGLTSNTTYYLHVRNMCAATSISTWVTISFVTQPCPQPGNLSVSNITATTATLSWSAANGYPDNAYVLDQSPANPVVPGTATTVPSFLATALQQNTDYYLHVRGLCAPTSISAWVTLHFKTGECGTPVNILAGNITDTSADLLWSQMMNVNAYEYKVDVLPPSLFTGIGAQSIGKFNAHVGGLNPGTKYYVYVRSHCFVADSSGWGVDSFETLTGCDIPLVQISGAGTNNPQANWLPVQGALGYEYAVTNDAMPPALGAQTLNTSLNLPLPVDGKEYHLHVRAICGSFTIFSWWNSQLLRMGTTGIYNYHIGDEMVVYPNPANDVLHIKGGNGGYVIHDLDGRVVIQGSSVLNDFTIDVSRLPKGLYFLKTAGTYLKFAKL
jgi:hypothetical protein